MNMAQSKFSTYAQTLSADWFKCDWLTKNYGYDPVHEKIFILSTLDALCRGDYSDLKSDRSINYGLLLIAKGEIGNTRFFEEIPSGTKKLADSIYCSTEEKKEIHPSRITILLRQMDIYISRCLDEQVKRGYDLSSKKTQDR